jgi:hypothetical protein
MNFNNNRKFKGIWVPKEIWLNKDLSMQEKMFIVEIDSLSGKEGCFATNEYFAEFFNLSKRRIQGVFQQLKEKNLIKITLIYNNKKEVEKRLIKINKKELENLYKSVMSELTGCDIDSDIVCDVDSDISCNVNSDTNISSNNYNIKKDNIKDKRQCVTTHSPKNSLIPKELKNIKKAKDIKTMVSLTNLFLNKNFKNNKPIEKSLKDYFNIRLKKGLISEQWKLILDNLEKYILITKCSNDNILEKINFAFASGYMQIIPEWELKKRKNNRSFDTSADNEIDEIEEGTSDNAVDENGNIYKF